MKPTLFLTNPKYVTQSMTPYMQHMTDAPVTLQFGSLLRKHLTITGIAYVGEKELENPRIKIEQN